MSEGYTKTKEYLLYRGRGMKEFHPDECINCLHFMGHGGREQGSFCYGFGFPERIDFDKTTTEHCKGFNTRGR